MTYRMNWFCERVKNHERSSRPLCLGALFFEQKKSCDTNQKAFSDLSNWFNKFNSGIT